MEAQSVDRRSVQRSTKLSEQLTSILREEVLTGRVRPGERIVQSEWAERLGVSRMPVRDAVNQLCTEGILVQQQSGQVFAAQIDPDDIRDGYYLNAVLASMAARRAATRISEDELAELKLRVHACFEAGALATGCRAEIAWGETLKPSEILAVASFVFNPFLLCTILSRSR